MVNIELISHIWDRIVESNTFNFVVFATIIALLLKKLNISAAFQAIQDKILKIINDANNEKEEAQGKLSEAEKSVENLATELENIINEAEKSAETISEKIVTEAKKQLEDIEQNATKVIQAEEKMLISTLSKETSKASVEKAKAHIKQTLNSTPSLHEKYINESIDELDRLTF